MAAWISSPFCSRFLCEAWVRCAELYNFDFSVCQVGYESVGLFFSFPALNEAFGSWRTKFICLGLSRRIPLTCAMCVQDNFPDIWLCRSLTINCDCVSAPEPESNTASQAARGWSYARRCSVEKVCSGSKGDCNCCRGRNSGLAFNASQSIRFTSANRRTLWTNSWKGFGEFLFFSDK